VKRTLPPNSLTPRFHSTGASSITNYGVLKLTPFWDPLRDDPRFEKIVVSLAPKDAASPAKWDSETEENLPSLYWPRVIADDNWRSN
jgi:hypothetical protein